MTTHVETVPIEDGPVTPRPDGSIAIQIDDVKIVWRPPRIRHVQVARDEWNRISQLARTGLARLQSALEDQDDTDSQDEAAEILNTEVQDACEAWVRAVHKQLSIGPGQLPDDVLDWPPWMPRLPFLTMVVQHWGRNPFASKSG